MINTAAEVSKYTMRYLFHENREIFKTLREQQLSG